MKKLLGVALVLSLTSGTVRADQCEVNHDCDERVHEVFVALDGPFHWPTVHRNLGSNSWQELKAYDLQPLNENTTLGQLVLGAKNTIWMAATLGDPYFSPEWCSALESMANNVYNNFENLGDTCVHNKKRARKALIFMKKLHNRFSHCLNQNRLTSLLGHKPARPGYVAEKFFLDDTMARWKVEQNLGSVSWNELKGFDQRQFLADSALGRYIDLLKSTIWYAATVGGPGVPQCHEIAAVARQMYRALDEYLETQEIDMNRGELKQVLYSLNLLDRMSLEFQPCFLAPELNRAMMKVEHLLGHRCEENR